MIMSSTLVGFAIVALSIITADDHVWMIILCMVFFGLGRGILASLIANCIGMVTGQKN